MTSRCQKNACPVFALMCVSIACPVSLRSPPPPQMFPVPGPARAPSTRSSSWSQFCLAMEAANSDMRDAREVFSVRTARQRVLVAEDVPAASARPVLQPTAANPAPTVAPAASASRPPDAAFLECPAPHWSDERLRAWLAQMDPLVLARVRALLRPRELERQELILGYCEQLCPNLCGNVCGRPMLNRPRPHQDHFCRGCHAQRRLQLHPVQLPPSFMPLPRDAPPRDQVPEPSPEPQS